MGNKVVGKAYIPGLGQCYVEVSDHKDFFVLRNIKTGYGYYRHRDRVIWR